ncbi:MAG: SGNH/GDSL hydrolase family protein, partial [Methylobacteriaceae bacterium]|nr:SGNH/GDSL hydrolase family protein [Methylobacteriaceae bacterium]
MRYLFLLIPLAGAAILYNTGYTNYTLLISLTLGFLFLVGVMIVVRGRLRDAALVIASIVLCLIVAETYEVITSRRSLAELPADFADSRPVLGWGPVKAGSFNAKKTDPKTGAVIYETTYTIDEHLLRQTSSAASGPTVAFFGDSFMFGEGLPDDQTLPQIFSDLTDRKLRVLNFAFPGYGPQQFLRALETRMYDDLLREAGLVVFETAAWHAERTACSPPFTLRAPRYVMRDGAPVYVGACAEGLTRLAREILGHSAAFRALVQPAQGPPNRADIDLYIAIVGRAATLARENYNVPTLVLYLPYTPAYLEPSGYTNEEIMQKLRDTGVEVLSGWINPLDYANLTLVIPGDGHPTGAANRLWAEGIKSWLDRNEHTL